MAFCAYKIIDIEGNNIKGKCLCTSKEDLTKTFRDKGYFLVFYKELNNKPWSLNKIKPSLKDLSIFCRQFASLLMVGINISEVINIIMQETINKYLKKSLIDMEHMVRQGVQLSHCMSSYKDIFPKFMINMVRIGEESGNLENVFDRLSEYYSREEQLKNKIMKALAYPSLILIVSIIVMQFLFFYIIPIFVTTLQELGGNIPKITEIALVFSNFLRNNFTSIIIVSFLFIITANYFRKIEGTTSFFQKQIMKNTFTKKIVQKVIAVKFSTTLGILLNSGIPIIKALDITRSVLDNGFIKDELEKCINNIKKGSTLSKSLSELNIFPKMLCSMTRIGEESGTLNEMLIKASNILEEELYNTIEKITSLIEPILIIFLSIFVGAILITLVGPMFNIMDTI